MGGFAAWNLAMRVWQHFAAVIPMAGGLSRWEAVGTDAQARFLLTNTVAVPLYVIHGSCDDVVSPEFDRASVAQLSRLGHPALEYVEVPRAGHALRTLDLHEDSEGAARLEVWLRGRRRNADPATIRHRVVDNDHGRAYWVEILGVGPRRRAEVLARRLRPDKYLVRVTGAKRLRLYLSGHGLRVGQSVSVTVNEITSTVEFCPDADAIVATYRQDLDPALLAAQIVELPVPAPAG